MPRYKFPAYQKIWYRKDKLNHDMMHPLMWHSTSGPGWSSSESTECMRVRSYMAEQSMCYRLAEVVSQKLGCKLEPWQKL